MPRSPVRLSELVASLTRALDLTEGQPQGHSMRACVIGMRVAEAADLDPELHPALLYALLLKDAGCSSNASRVAHAFGTDDQGPKYDLKLSDWQRPLRAALFAVRNAGRGQGPLTRIRHLLGLARGNQQVGRELIRIRCERGAGIVASLGFPQETAEAIHALDEHWNGRGHPDGLEGEEIPLLARICGLAQTAEVFHREHGLDAMVAMLRQRRGRWFDPDLTDRLLELSWNRRWWMGLDDPGLDGRVAALDVGRRAVAVTDTGLDGIARAFADIIDAKSPFTARHSANVARYARAIGGMLGLTAEELRDLYRAGLLHDIGKLGVSSRILEKPGTLTRGEQRAIRRHPVHTWQILADVPAFRGFAREAALHHERLDGAGYPWGFGVERLPLVARILAVADVFEALTADRPYRPGMAPGRALEILRGDAGSAVDVRCVEALEGILDGPRLADWAGGDSTPPLAELFAARDMAADPAA